MEKRLGLIIPLLGYSLACHGDHTTVVLPASVDGPASTNSADLPDAGETSFSVQFQQIDFKAIREADFEHASEHGESLHGTDEIKSTSLNFSWSATDRLTFGISIPRIERTGLVEAAHHGDEEGEVHQHGEEDSLVGEEAPDEIIEQLGSAKGIGDARIFGNYQLWSNVDSQGSLLLGVKAPTADDDELSLDGHLLEAEFQPGSDSWDSMLGFVYSRQLGSWSFDSNLLYSFVNKGSQRTDLGDILNYNFAFSYPLPDINLFGTSPWRSSLLLEVNGEWRDRVEIQGREELNSGGNLLYFSPGLSISNGTWFASASIGRAVENLNGIQSEPNNRFIFNIGRSF